MREETVVKYIADDGVAFKDKLDCLNYEKLCEKYKKWLADGKVMFWDHYEKYLNFDLCTGTAGTNYIDWLKMRLTSAIGYITINEHPCCSGWTAVWEFVTKFCSFDEDDIRRIEPTYREGDLLSYDPNDCRFHNIDLVIRNANVAKERMMKDLAHKAFNAGKEEEENEGTC
jgi:hypothetical protein